MNSTVVLKSGETLECRIIEDPGDDHTTSLRLLLSHKGPLWDHHLDAWQDGRIKRLETRFYVGLIGAKLVGNIMTVEYRGIGIMGHVFTPPEHRRKGICDALMGFHMDDFRDREGAALYLNTGYDSPPWHIYRRYGYQPIQGAPGSMWWSPGAWKPDDLFSSLGKVDIREPAWHHWPSMNAFMLLPMDIVRQIVRNASYGRFGVSNAEAQFLEIVRDAEAENSPVQARVLETHDGHVAGLATLAPDRRWGTPAATYVFDLNLHPDVEEDAEEITSEFVWPEQAHVLAYAAESDDRAIDLLADCGFHPHSHIERFFAGEIGLVVMDRG